MKVFVIFAIITISLRCICFDLVNNKKERKNPKCFLQMCKDALKNHVIAPSPIPVAEGTAIHDCLGFWLFFFSFKNPQQNPDS